jgi:DNA-binding FadR family transcriptional regulator
MVMKVPASELITEYLLNEWFRVPGRAVGDELPTIVELFDQFGVGGVQTVRDGVKPLKDAGYVETRYAPTRRWVVRQLPPSGGKSASPARRSLVSAVPSPVVLDQIREELVAAGDAVGVAIAMVDRLRLAAQP